MCALKGENDTVREKCMLNFCSAKAYLRPQKKKNAKQNKKQTDLPSRVGWLGICFFLVAKMTLKTQKMLLLVFNYCFCFVLFVVVVVF